VVVAGEILTVASQKRLWATYWNKVERSKRSKRTAKYEASGSQIPLAPSTKAVHSLTVVGALDPPVTPCIQHHRTIVLNVSLLNVEILNIYMP
jgi:hypothetical protein